MEYAGRFDFRGSSLCCGDCEFDRKMHTRVGVLMTPVCFFVSLALPFLFACSRSVCRRFCRFFDGLRRFAIISRFSHATAVITFSLFVLGPLLASCLLGRPLCFVRSDFLLFYYLLSYHVFLIFPCAFYCSLWFVRSWGGLRTVYS